MATITERIAALELKLKQEKAKQQQIEARKKSIEKKIKRSEETRRKILAGAFVLERLDVDGSSADSLELKGQKFSNWLVREDDRALFDLPVVAKTE